MMQRPHLRNRFDGDVFGPWRRLITSALLLLSLLTFGVLGYMIIEGWSFFDALFMTVTTITTVGFREVQPLDTSGRIFTIFVILFGVGTAFYILTTVVQSAVEGEFAEALGVRRMQQRIDALRDHYILCGFGRVGEEIAHEYTERSLPFVIVENNPEAVSRAQRHNYLLIEGDATQDEMLERAGVRYARALLAASDSDAGNTYITLTAKALRPELLVIARVGQPAGEPRAVRAGAERVISPYKLAGRRMALSALQPLAVDFFDVLATGRVGGPLLAELVVTEESEMAGQTIHDVLHRSTATSLLAVQTQDGTLTVGPPDTHVISLGDRLILLSNEPDIESLGRTKSN
jgi:voltage-gated potassium channel